MNKDNYLVTGSSGFVGFPLVNKFLDKKCFVQRYLINLTIDF